MLITMGWHLSSQQQVLIRSLALNKAKLLTNVLRKTRAIYTSDVVIPVQRLGVEITHDDKEKTDAIPLPATFSMRIAQAISAESDGASSSLYSPYPFPWRKNTGGLRDVFAINAWRTLVANPDSTYIEFQHNTSGFVLRYASADLMKPACLYCHNTHPDSPKKGWKVGDVRGVLEVTIPLESLSKNPTSQLSSTLFIYLASLFTMISLGVVVYRLYESKLRLTAISETDPLTNIANRRAYDIQLVNKIMDAKRTKQPLTLLMIDIDYFKQFNDYYGHSAGDKALISVASAIKRSLPRLTDFTARYGGEEFVVLLPSTGFDGGYDVAERIRSQVIALAIEHKGSKVIDLLTVSIGVSSLAREELNENDLLKKADIALYVAKKTGRNRIRKYEKS